MAGPPSTCVITMLVILSVWRVQSFMLDRVWYGHEENVENFAEFRSFAIPSTNWSTHLMTLAPTCWYETLPSYPHCDCTLEFPKIKICLRKVRYTYHSSNLKCFSYICAGPPYVVVEFAHYGNLRDFLRSRRPPEEYEKTVLLTAAQTLTNKELMSMAYQVARGMEFLASKRVSTLTSPPPTNHEVKTKVLTHTIFIGSMTQDGARPKIVGCSTICSEDHRDSGDRSICDHSRYTRMRIFIASTCSVLHKNHWEHYYGITWNRGSSSVCRLSTTVLCARTITRRFFSLRRSG